MGSAERRPDAKVLLNGEWLAAHGWSMGNPHLVVFDADVATADLRGAPEIDPAQPDGANVEVVQITGERALRMRVYERGVGETQSCGTGACAAAVAAMALAGERATYAVEVPGGRLQVSWHDDGSVMLTGPAVLVAEGEWRGSR
jgi:diaminopimelate epimerase